MASSSFLVCQRKLRQGKVAPCAFVQSHRQIAVSVHGGEYIAAGPYNDFVWYEQEIQKAYEVTI